MRILKKCPTNSCNLSLQSFGRLSIVCIICAPPKHKSPRTPMREVERKTHRRTRLSEKAHVVVSEVDQSWSTRVSSSKRARGNGSRNLATDHRHAVNGTGSRRRERRHGPAQDVEWKTYRRGGEPKPERKPIDSRSRHAEYLMERLWYSKVTAAASVGMREIGKRV